MKNAVKKLDFHLLLNAWPQNSISAGIRFGFRGYDPP